MARNAAFAIGLAALAASCAHAADARGSHGLNHGLNHGLGGGMHGMHGAGGGQLSGDRRYGNDTYAKAASDERDRLLNTKMKSICRGC
jgi:hypothetical protein